MAKLPDTADPATPTPAKAKAPAQPLAAGGGASKRGKRAPKAQQQQQQATSAPVERERTTTAGSAGGAAPPKLKIVVRRLPANIPEEVFWSSTAQWVNDETAGWKVFRKGKVAKSFVPSPLAPWSCHLTYRMTHLACRDKEPTQSRAYILFKSQAALLDFHRSYDGHLFRDKAGAPWRSHIDLGRASWALTRPLLLLTGIESVAVVEYAVYQKVPIARPKPDLKAGSIDTGSSFPVTCFAHSFSL